MTTNDEMLLVKRGNRILERLANLSSRLQRRLVETQSIPGGGNRRRMLERRSAPREGDARTA